MGSGWKAVTSFLAAKVSPFANCESLHQRYLQIAYLSLIMAMSRAISELLVDIQPAFACFTSSLNC
jgi:hypothetical protein